MRKRLVSLYLQKGVDALEARATGQTESKDSIGGYFEGIDLKLGHTTSEARNRRGEIASIMAKNLTKLISEQETITVKNEVDALAETLKSKHGIKISSSEKKSLSIKLMNIDKQLWEAESVNRR